MYNFLEKEKERDLGSKFRSFLTICFLRNFILSKNWLCRNKFPSLSHYHGSLLNMFHRAVASQRTESMKKGGFQNTNPMCFAFFCGLIIGVLTLLDQPTVPRVTKMFGYFATKYFFSYYSICSFLVGWFLLHFLKSLTVKMHAEENSRSIEKLKLKGTSAEQLVQLKAGAIISRPPAQTMSIRVLKNPNNRHPTVSLGNMLQYLTNLLFLSSLVSNTDFLCFSLFMTPSPIKFWGSCSVC